MIARRFVILGALLAVMALPWRSSHADKVPYYRLDLQQCMKLALKNNEEIKAAGHDIDVIVAKKIEATKRYVPVTKYAYRVGPVPRDLSNVPGSLANFDLSVFNSFKLELGAPISTFGRLGIAKTLADLGVELKGLEQRKKADEVLLNVYKLYQGILLARELKSIIKQGLDAVDGKIGELEKEETTDQLGILKLKVVLYEAERRYQESMIKEEIAIETMKVLMGLDSAVNFDIVDRGLRQDAFRSASFDHLLAESKKNRPEFRLLERGVLARSQQIALEKKEYLPKLGVGAFADYGITPGITGDENNNNFVNPFNYTRAGLGIELSGSLDFRQIKSKVSQAEAEHLKTIAQKRAAFRGLELDLKKSFLELKQHQFLLARAQNDQKAARQIVVLTKSNLDIGLGETKDYLEALQSYLVFQGREMEAIFNYNSAVATLKSKMGLLLPRPNRDS